eukprot:TRINITY_DN1069_c0_g1_i11.p1 TRINITY_DN1069_c0_g1~~TRINITY_DN1069_c0_g1_i11.p1  ORF type:complete len:362 (+),score=90.71 TRINITY_DN1069_c0_g1_i11:1788-2873(+)
MKKPSGGKVKNDGILNSPEVLGQCYDFMMALRNYFGIKNVFGILTTYEEWRICWLPECDHAALSDAPSSEELAKERPTPTQSQKMTDLLARPHEIGDNFPDEVLELTGTPPAEADPSRCLHGTEVKRFDDENLLDMLASVVCKMYVSPQENIDLFDRKWYRIYADEQKLCWRPLKLDGSPRFFAGSSIQSSGYFLLHSVGRGKYGKVWLAVKEANAQIVALKIFYCMPPPAEKELKVWTAYKPEFKVSVVTVAGLPALCMPYLAPLKRDNKEIFSEGKTQDDLVREAVREFASCGYEHKDIRFDQLGSYLQNGRVAVSLLDFGQVEKIDKDDKIEREESVKRMLDTLEQEYTRYKEFYGYV